MREFATSSGFIFGIKPTSSLSVQLVIISCSHNPGLIDCKKIRFQKNSIKDIYGSKITYSNLNLCLQIQKFLTNAFSHSRNGMLSWWIKGIHWFISGYSLIDFMSKN